MAASEAVPTSAPPLPPRSHHVPRRGAEGEEGAVEIDLQHAVPFLGGHLDEGCEPRPAETPALAKQPSTRPSTPERLGEGGLDRASRRRRRIRAPATLRPVACELGLRGGVLGRVGAPDGDVGAGLGHRVGHAEADAAIAAGDQRHLAGQIEWLVGHGVFASRSARRAACTARGLRRKPGRARRCRSGRGRQWRGSPSSSRMATGRLRVRR